MAARDYGQYDGVTRALELVGERWGLLIVRDLLVGPRRYGELAEGLPRIPTNILAARLKELQAAGIIRRLPRSRVILYELTPYGRELEPVVLSLSAWGFKALDDPRDGQVLTPDGMAIALRSAFRHDAAAALPPTSYAAGFAGTDVLIRVDGPELGVQRGTAPADLEFATDSRIRAVLSGDLDSVRVLSGDPRLLDRFAATFRLAA
ncbi:MAG: helix-turn-helix transcriptional regulator [Demequina sp.]|nr:helix-turn-helix transcriptional regulator [Demequina sp.]